MKFRYLSTLFVLSLVLLLSACNTGADPQEHLGEVYAVALESVMEQDKALNHEMEYIAIDMSNFEGVNESDREEILSYFKDKYEVEVMASTLDQLKEEGLYHSDTMSLDGVLLSINEVEFQSNNNVFFEGYKYRSGTGAVEAEVTVHYEDDEWKPKETKMTTVS